MHEPKPRAFRLVHYATSSVIASSSCTTLKHAQPAKCVQYVLLLVESGLSQSGS